MSGTSFTHVEDFVRRALANINLVLDHQESFSWKFDADNRQVEVYLTRLGISEDFIVAERDVFDLADYRVDAFCKQFVDVLVKLRDRCNQELWVAADLCADHGFTIAEAAIRANIKPQKQERKKPAESD